MPLQNRVLPDGAVVALDARCTMMGNRGGAFHDSDRNLRQRHWVSQQWICCLLDFGGRQRQVMQPGRYTELFFLDEATALAAGHRPCFECRRAAALDFAMRWSRTQGLDRRAGAPIMDLALHTERLQRDGRAKRTYIAPCGVLPDNTLIRLGRRFLRVAGAHLQAWSPEGYGELVPRDRAAEVEVLTPPSTVAVLGAGYVPMLHKSAAT